MGEGDLWECLQISPSCCGCSFLSYRPSPLEDAPGPSVPPPPRAQTSERPPTPRLSFPSCCLSSSSSVCVPVIRLHRRIGTSELGSVCLPWSCLLTPAGLTRSGCTGNMLVNDHCIDTGAQPLFVRCQGDGDCPQIAKVVSHTLQAPPSIGKISIFFCSDARGFPVGFALSQAGSSLPPQPQV